MLVGLIIMTTIIIGVVIYNCFNYNPQNEIRVYNGFN